MRSSFLLIVALMILGIFSVVLLARLVPDNSPLTALYARFSTFSAFAQTEPPFNASQPRKYRVCEANGQCITKLGKGINQCRTNDDCKTTHAACVGNTCILVPEPGQDECAVGASCDPTVHKTCVNFGVGPQCAVVPGAPKPNEVTCDENQDCIDADIPPQQERPKQLASVNFCGANGTPCVCSTGRLPINPSTVKSFNTLIHAEPSDAVPKEDAYANRWQLCGSPYCAVDLRVGFTADQAYQTALSGVPVFSPINGTVGNIYTLRGGYGSCVVIGAN